MKHPTAKQIALLHFCEEVLYDVSFEGNIDDQRDVMAFLREYLEEAKYIYSDEEDERRHPLIEESDNY